MLLFFGVQNETMKVHKERVFTMNHLKKTAALLLAAASVSSAVVAAHADGVLKGDMNSDGVIDSGDALLTLHASLAPELLNSSMFEIADYNIDGVVDATDALLILRESVDLGERNFSNVSTPVEKEPEVSNNYSSPQTFTQVSEMEGWSSAEVVRKVGPLFTEDQRKTGILASVSCAQFIIESGYGQSRLSLEANNCFGIKGKAEATPRVDCPWDGISVYVISTKEYDKYGNVYYENASFRKYACMEDSIADHSRILITSTDGSKKRYEGIVGCTDYRKAAQIIRNGGYATDPGYVDLICDVIKYWNLTQYDLASQTASKSFDYPTLSGSDAAEEIVDEDKTENEEVTTEDAQVQDTKSETESVSEIEEDPSAQISASDIAGDEDEDADSDPDYSDDDEEDDEEEYYF